MQAVGWASAVVLTCTILAQVARQWRSRDPSGVSPWLYVGQTAASTGFVVYSVALGDAVFVATNAILLVAAVTGIALLVRDRRRARRTDAAAAAPASG